MQIDAEAYYKARIEILEQINRNLQESVAQYTVLAAQLQTEITELTEKAGGLTEPPSAL